MKHIILFHGPNIWQMEDTLKAWVKAFEEKHNGDMNIECLEGDRLNYSEIINKAAPLPFLSEKRLLIIKNFMARAHKDEQKTLSDNLAKIPDHSIVILVESKTPDKRTSLYKKLSKECRVEFFEELQDLSLTQWIISQTQKYGAQIKASTANYASAYIGNSCQKLDNELQKLSLYKYGQEISPEDIQTLSVPMLETSIFQLTDLLGFKKYREAIAILEKIIQSGEELPMIFHMLVRQFRLIFLIKTLEQRRLSSKDIASQLKQHPFVVGTVLKQSNKYSFNDLESIYRKLLDIEIAFKTGGITLRADDNRDFVLALERFIIPS